jgi:hypothetical protein
MSPRHFKLTVNDFVVSVGNGDGNSLTAVQAVCGAADSWVVSAHRHFDGVENPLVDLTVCGKTPKNGSKKTSCSNPTSSSARNLVTS